MPFSFILRQLTALRALILALMLALPSAAAGQTVTITSPADGDRVADTTPLFAGTAEAGRDVVLRIYTATGPLISVPLTTDTGGNWSHEPASPLNEGPAQAEIAYAIGTGDAIVDFTIVGPAPEVVSLNLNGTPSPSAASVSYTLTFSEAVTGVDTSDFSLTTSGGVTAIVAAVTGFGAVYTVDIVNIEGTGTLRPRLNSAGSGITDVAGSLVSQFTFDGTTHTVDRVPPGTPAFTNFGGVTTFTSGNFTFTGTAEAGVDVLLSIDGNSPVIVPVDGSGNWSYASPFTLTEGGHTVNAQARDAAGNLSGPASYSFTVDSTAPPAPVIAGPPNGIALPDATPTITGTAEPGATVLVNIDGSPVGAATAQANGVWTFQTTVALAEGSHTVNASARDGAGNTSPSSNTVTFVVDTVAPVVTWVFGPQGAVFGTGAVLDFSVNFSEAVTVIDNGSFARLRLTIGTQTYYADYRSGSGTSVLFYRLVVPAGAQDNDGLTLEALEGNGGIIIDDATNAANLALNGIAIDPLIIDAAGPTVVLSAPPGLQTGPFTLTITFSEDIYNFTADDVAAVNATVSDFSGSSGNYVATITPTGGEITLSVAAGAAEDEAGNPSLAATPLVVATASALTEFDVNSDEIRAIITDQTLRDLRARIAATERMVKAAQDRLTSDAPAVDRALSFQGILQADGVTIASKGSFDAETGLANGTRRILWGEFNVTRDAEGTTSARLDTTLAWERRLSDDALAAWFLGLEVGSADVDRSFSGPLQTLGVSLGAYGVQRLNDALYLRGFASVTAGRNDLELSNGILSLQSDYTTRSLQAGATLSGDLPMDGWTLRPELSLSVGRTWLGTLDLTGTAYGQTGAFQLDAGEVTLATLTFQPEFVVPLDGRPVADALSLLTVAPGLTCESVSGVEDWSDCGLALGLGLQHQSDNGLVRYNADLDVTRVGPRKDTSLSLSLEHRF